MIFFHIRFLQCKNDFPAAYVDKEKGVVLNWDLRTIKERVYNNPNQYPVYYLKESALRDNAYSSGASTGVSGSGVGIGGSMARFGIKDKVLYVVDQNTLKVFDITNKTIPVKVNDMYPGWNVETMFLTGNKMFLGTTTGMAIYDISNPLSPVSSDIFQACEELRSCNCR